MSIVSLLSCAVSLVSAQNPDPSFAVTAHPFALLGLPAIAAEDESWMLLQLDAVHKPAQRWSPVVHLAWSRLAVDIPDTLEKERTDINRLTAEVGARWRLSPDRGWYLEGTLGYLFESYKSTWIEGTETFSAPGIPTRVVSKLEGDVQNTFHEPYVMAYAGWASNPSKRIRWDLGIGLGYALMGGTRDLEDITWKGDLSLKDPDQSVDLFAAAPLVFDLNVGVGVNF